MPIGSWTYLPEDEESVGAIRREGVCVTCIPNPSGQHQTDGPNLTLKVGGIVKSNPKKLHENVQSS